MWQAVAMARSTEGGEMQWKDGARPRYFARLYREGPWWSVEFRDCPGCLASGRGRHEALLMAGDALATWSADVPPLRLPKPTGPRAGEVLIEARFFRSTRMLDLWGGTRYLAPLAVYWMNKEGGWR
ncbi:type II toxin-antitoxin system HicB family antitoxin [Xanthobacter autotrophicus]|uniref:type II toxin-antitoxin system HicB family antitoxin n=1 Tax=Xanthobacter autotrophicus TaxID=280 RepID=UPI0037287D89